MLQGAVSLARPRPTAPVRISDRGRPAPTPCMLTMHLGRAYGRRRVASCGRIRPPRARRAAVPLSAAAPHLPTLDRARPAPCDNTGRAGESRPSSGQEDRPNVPVLATYFSVRRGRDPFFKFFMRTIFPRQVKDYEEKFGIKFIGWFNVAHGWDFDNVILLDLPDYATLDKLEADEATRALGHRAGEWIFERHHSMFLRERMGPDLEYHP